jgi:hypothetical protein
LHLQTNDARALGLGDRGSGVGTRVVNDDDVDRRAVAL